MATASTTAAGAKTSSIKAGQFVGMMFFARTLTHRAHLQTTSYARHMALEGFYESIVDLTDRFAETYAGRFGIIDNIPVSYPDDGSDILEILRKQHDWIDINRDSIVAMAYTPLQNIIDEIEGEYLQTIYKLENLK